jgi:hypothetical protein
METFNLTYYQDSYTKPFLTLTKDRTDLSSERADPSGTALERTSSNSELQTRYLVTDPEVRVRLPELPVVLRSSGSGTGSTQPRECN